ncbi:MAG TPA: putative sulfate exporter family transporter, partial [Candidatus Rokubacteria bacterium]|nr:putative sulfate exporter family transporter [Candidatus Rokubacteria bacterium]
AIAACGAIQGDKKKLSYVTSLVLIVAVPMMIVMPWIVRATGMPDAVGGAWLGGTLDTSGSVVAAGALISEPALKAGVIVKFSQNVLIGVAAFLLSVWWTFRQRAEGGERPRARVIWDRFPKFVLGFLVTSAVFSFVLDAATVSTTKGTLNGLRTVWFALAFTCIGLETRFTELVSMGRGRPAAAFLAAQAFNVVWTLLLAYLLFGGVLFPAPLLR